MPAESKEIIIELCPYDFGKIDIEKTNKADGAIEIDQFNKVITIPIQPSDTPNPYGEIIVPISKVPPFFCDGEEWIWWERETEQVEGYETETILRPYPTISVIRPDTCLIKKIEVDLFGPPSYTAYGKKYWIFDPGPDYKAGIESWDENQNLIYPGAELRVAYTFKKGADQEKKYENVSHTWWCTCCFTGGKIKETQDPGKTEARYLVEIQGKEIWARPSDFVEYEVGDWVFVAKPNAGDCGKLNRTSPCKAGCEDETEEAGSEIDVGATMLDLVNQARESYGSAPLTSSESLCAAAGKHAQDCSDNCFVGHEGSDGSQIADRTVDYWAGAEAPLVAENVTLAASISEAFQNFQNSPEHWANILNSQFAHFGIAAASADKCTSVYQQPPYDKTFEYPPNSGLKFYVQVFGTLDSTGGAWEPPPTDEWDYRILPMKIDGEGP